MARSLLLLLTMVTLLISCNNKQKQTENVTEEKKESILTVDDLLENMQKYVNKSITVSGTVNHVCAHGGKRMFIIGSNPDIAIKILPGEKISVFERELEGSNVEIIGTLKELRIDEAYVNNMEKQLNDGLDNEAAHDHSAGTHNEEDDEAKAKINEMREKIEESNHDYYSQFWIEADDFKILEKIQQNDVEDNE